MRGIVLIIDLVYVNALIVLSASAYSDHISVALVKYLAVVLNVKIILNSTRVYPFIGYTNVSLGRVDLICRRIGAGNYTSGQIGKIVIGV